MFYHTLQGCLLKPEDHTLGQISSAGEPYMDECVRAFIPTSIRGLGRVWANQSPQASCP